MSIGGKTEAWTQVGPKFTPTLSPNLPRLGLLWTFLPRVVSVPLGTQGSSPRSSWMTTRGRETESPVNKVVQVRGQLSSRQLIPQKMAGVRASWK